MGFFFELNNANLVVYLTTPHPDQIPRVTARQLTSFLDVLSYPDRHNPRLISSDREWPERIAYLAHRARDRFGMGWTEEIVDTSICEDLLDDLHREFSNYDLYMLPVGVRGDEGRLDAFVRHAAYTSESRALVLIPNYPDPFEALAVFDPTPPIRQLAERPENWPGVLFWLPHGESAFAPLREAERLFHRLSNVLEQGVDALGEVLQKYNQTRPGVMQRRLLHLSDLHFGTPAALNNEPYLMTHIQSILGDFDRVVITGDLFDNPKVEDYRGFYRFLIFLKNLTGKDPIIVPGNHDQRRFGNSFAGIGQEFSQLANLRWNPVVIDSDLRCTFLCFNSSEEGNWARGSISRNQLRDVATEYESRKLTDPGLNRFSRIAVTHHHPFPFEERTEKLIPRSPNHLFVGKETFVGMDNAEQFLKWCAARDVPLIMHGHKHIPRYISKWVPFSKSAGCAIAAVGSGASLGIGERPMSYNLLSWVPSSDSWSVKFMNDPGDGSGFKDDYIVLQSASPLESDVVY